MQDYTKDHLNGLDVNELRRIAREGLRELSIRDDRTPEQKVTITAPVFVTSRRKATLIDIILNRHLWPHHYGFDGEGNAPEEAPQSPATPSTPDTDPEPLPTPKDATHALADTIGAALAALAKTTITVDSVRDMVVTEVKRLIPRTIEVKTEFDARKITGRQHKHFELILKIVGANVPLMLVGPAGSGKTHAAASVAESLGLDFYPYSCDESTQRFDMTGYNDANGRYVAGVLHAPFTLGGLLLLDEIDRSGPALTTLNAAIANGYMTFPNGTAKRHANTRYIAAANTIGTGADWQYTSAVRIDAATRDRFAVLMFDYDESLERSMIGLDAPNPRQYKAKNTVTAENWLDRVHAIRKATERSNAPFIVSPRVTVYGVRLLEAGIDAADVESLLVWNKTDKATADRIRGEIK